MPVMFIYLHKNYIRFMQLCCAERSEDKRITHAVLPTGFAESSACALLKDKKNMVIIQISKSFDKKDTLIVSIQHVEEKKKVSFKCSMSSLVDIVSNNL